MDSLNNNTNLSAHSNGQLMYKKMKIVVYKVDYSLPLITINTWPDLYLYVQLGNIIHSHELIIKYSLTIITF